MVLLGVIIILNHCVFYKILEVETEDLACPHSHTPPK